MYNYSTNTETVHGLKANCLEKLSYAWVMQGHSQNVLKGESSPDCRGAFVTRCTGCLREKCLTKSGATGTSGPPCIMPLAGRRKKDKITEDKNITVVGQVILVSVRRVIYRTRQIKLCMNFKAQLP